MAMEKFREAAETPKPERNDFKEIKPQTGMTEDRAKDVVKSFFEDVKSLADSWDVKEQLKEFKKEYSEELKAVSEFKDTLPDEIFDIADLKKIDSNEHKVRKEEFDKLKRDLKKQWEEKYNIPWPKYKEDVYIENNEGEPVRIREAGNDLDMHHIQPLGLNGKNEVSNITPLSAEVHFDKKYIHRSDGPYDKMVKLLGGE